MKQTPRHHRGWAGKADQVGRTACPSLTCPAIPNQGTDALGLPAAPPQSDRLQWPGDQGSRSPGQGGRWRFHHRSAICLVTTMQCDHGAYSNKVGGVVALAVNRNNCHVPTLVRGSVRSYGPRGTPPGRSAQPRCPQSADVPRRHHRLRSLHRPQRLHHFPQVSSIFVKLLNLCIPIAHKASFQ